ncbi:CPCC family cysteine-rich protein [Streptomyces sp900105755]|uniref:CPCC family cysteine-rich protein n=1 Tax=Streptomyces sp. 900105755 TaxID=3154389 RepID=UPI00331CC1F2
MSAMVSEESLSSPSNDAAGGLIACPCCFQRTLEERANFEICPECGWEDDGQDDADAHIARGGPNGRLSLTQARLDYLESAAGGGDESLTRGGEGLWISEARRQMPDVAE